MLAAIQLQFYFIFCFFLLTNYTKFSCYKLVIYFLNNFLLNICLLYLLILLYFIAKNLNWNFIFFIMLYIISETKIIYPLNKGLYFYFMTIFTPSLQVGLVLYHPPLFYLSFLFFLFYTYSFFSKYVFYYQYILIISILTLMLGGFWGWSAFTWGFYWVFDLIELILLILVIFIIIKIHMRFSYHSYLLLPILSLFCIIITLRLGLIATRHSFFTKRKIIKYLYYIVVYYLIFNSYFMWLDENIKSNKSVKLFNCVLLLCFIKNFYIYLGVLYIINNFIIRFFYNLKFKNFLIWILHVWFFYFWLLIFIHTSNYLYQVFLLRREVTPRKFFYYTTQTYDNFFKISRIKIVKKIKIFMFESNELTFYKKYKFLKVEDIFSFKFNQSLTDEKKYYYNIKIIKVIILKLFLLSPLFLGILLLI